MSLTPGKLYYSISELSDHFEVAPSLLRYWENEFPSIRPKRNPKGTRFYTIKDVEEISQIHLLVKVKGFTLQGAKEQLKSNKSKIDSDIKLIEKLESLKDFLTKLRDQI